MNQLSTWVLTNPLPAVHDLESLTSVEMVARLYAAMQSLINEVNEHIAQVNKTVGIKIQRSGMKQRCAR